MDATARLVAIIAVAAFATERILAAINFLIDAAAPPRNVEWRKVVLLGLAAVIGYFVVDRANLRLLRVLEVDNVHPLVDFWLTWLVVVAGADRVHSMLGAESEEGRGSEETPTISVRVDGGEIHELHRVR